MRSEAQIQRLTDDQARSLIQLYEKGEARIEKQINAALLRGSDAEYLKAVQANIKTARTDLLAGSRTWCEKSVPYLYREGVAYADEMAFSTHLAAGFGTIHQQAASALADAMYARTLDMDGIIGRRVDDLFRALQLEASEGSVLGFESTKQSAKVMKEELAKKGITGFVDKAGRKWSMKTYTEMAVHQVTMDSFREGTRLRLLEHGYDLIIVSSHSTACEQCIPWQGKTLSLTGKTKGYSTLADARAGGLLHVRCRHVYTLSPEEEKRGDAKNAPVEKPYNIDADGITNMENLNRITNKYELLADEFKINDKFGGFRSYNNIHTPASVKHWGDDSFVTAWGGVYDPKGNILRDKKGDMLHKVFVYMPPDAVNTGKFSQLYADMGIVYAGDLEATVTHEFAHIIQKTAVNKFGSSAERLVLDASEKAIKDAGITPAMIQKNISMYANGFMTDPTLVKYERHAEFFTAAQTPSSKMSAAFKIKLKKYQELANEYYQEWGGVGRIV